MYIECQQCDTTFRLDESLLKPTGSKVRCSQCGHIFVALPPAAEPATAAQAIAAPTTAPSKPEPALDQPSAEMPEPVEEKGEELGLQEIDLAELDTLFAQDQEIPVKTAAAVSEAKEVDVAAELDESEFEIDFEAALEADDSIVATPAEEPAPAEDVQGAPDDLDLELDFDLGDDLVAEEEPPAAGEISVESSQEMESLRDADVGAPEDDFELALDDVDLEAGGDETVFADMASADSETDGDAAAVTSPEEPEQEEEIPDLDLDLESELDLGLDDESKAVPAASADESEAASDLDLDDDFFSDLDNILDETKLEGAEDSETKEEVELELDEGSDESNAADQESADEDLEELAFELDAEYEDKPIAQAAESEPSLEIEDDDGEIDLTEIELMLEGNAEEGITSVRRGDEVGEQTSAGDDFDLGLEDEIDLAELTMAIEKADLAEANDTATIAEDELELALASDDDVSEVTDVTDLSEVTDVTDLSLDEELESPDQPAEAESPSVDASEDELDLSDLDDLVLEKPDVAQRDVVDSGDIELEFQIEEDEQEATPQIQEHLDTLTPDTAPAMDQIMEVPEPEEELEPIRAPKPKKKTSKLLLVILILVLLGAIGYGVYYADTEMGIKIPYVSDWVSYVRDYVTPKPKDPAGTANLSTLDINSKFIENEQSGRLFVITGKVHNGYKHNRGLIRLQGKIFTKGKVLAQTESVFAGNLLDDQQLVALPFADIKKQLATPPRNGTPGMKVLPNQNLAFMVAFSDLPPADDLEEFAVEVLKSIEIQ